jgi:hypothetical protein
MAQQRRYTRWAGNYPPGRPAEWLADGHVTCSVHCLNGKCDRRIVNVRLDALPQDQPWSVGDFETDAQARDRITIKSKFWPATPDVKK